MTILPDELILALILFTMLVAALYGRKYHNWLMLAWDVALAWMALFYAGLVFDIIPDTDITTRLALFRPAFVLFLVFVCAFLINGRINQAISWMHCYGIDAARRIHGWATTHLPHS